MFGRSKFISNFSIRIGTNFLSKILGFISLPIITRSLGPELYGKWNLLLTILGFISIPFSVGIITYGVREVAKGNLKITDSILSSRLTILFLVYIPSLLLLFILFQNDSDMLFGFIIGALYLVAVALNIEFYYIGISNFKLPALSQIVGQSLFLIGVIFFINEKNDFKNLTILYTFYYLISACVLLYYLRKKQDFRVILNIKNSIRLLLNTYKIGISGIIENFSVSLPLIFIAAILGNQATGIFSASFKLISLVLLGFSTIITVITPKLVRLKFKSLLEIKQQIKNLTLLFSSIALLAALLIYFSADYVIVLVYGDKFTEAIPMLKLFAIAYLPFLSLGILYNNILIYFELDTYYLKSTIISFITLIIVLPITLYLFPSKGVIIGMSTYMLTYMTCGLYYITNNLRNSAA